MLVWQLKESGLRPSLADSLVGSELEPQPEPAESQLQPEPASPEAPGGQRLPCQIIMSVPLRHSWKPPIDRLLEGCVQSLGMTIPPRSSPAAPKSRLELFARELRTGWTSMGDEVLLFQERALYAARGTSH